MRLHRKSKVVQLCVPAVYTTAIDGQNAAVDTTGFEEMLVVVNLGAMSASLSLTVTMTQSDEAAANFAALPASAQTGINPRALALLTADASTVIVGYYNLKSLKRYLKPTEILNGNSAAYGMNMVLFGPDDSVKTNDTNQPLEPDGT